MKLREVRYKFAYPRQDSLKIRGAGSLINGLGSMGLISRSLQRRVNRLEKVCQNLDAENSEKAGRVFPIISQEELVKAFTRIIDELPLPEKTLFSLYYCEELNFGEIGEVLGLSELKVIRLFRDGMKKVAKKMLHKAAN